MVDTYLAVFGGQAQLTTDVIDLCPVQVPMSATPFDRKLGVKMGMRAGQYFADDRNTSASVVLLNAATFDLLPI